MKKQIIALTMSAAMCLLTACGSSASSSDVREISNMLDNLMADLESSSDLGSTPHLV